MKSSPTLIQTTKLLSSLCKDEDVNLRRLDLRRQTKSTIDIPPNSRTGSAVLNAYKKDVRSEKYRYNPGRELRIIAALRDRSEDCYTRADWQYLERRHRKTAARVEKPSAYQRACGSTGGLVSIWEKKSYQGFKIAAEILEML